MLRFLAIFALLAAFVTIALSFHQPPMRLMPTPTAFQIAGKELFGTNPDLVRKPQMEVFYVTNRLPVGPRNNRLYAVVPGRDLNAGVATVRVGGEDTTWDDIYDISTRGALPEDSRRPRLHLDRLTEIATFEDGSPPPAGARAWYGLINQALAKSRDPDIIVYVHGANSTVERAVGQAAQLRHFTAGNSVVVLFAWPTAENFLRYSKDMTTAFGAAPKLAELVELLAANTNARNIDILTYSAGGTVGSEGLALLGRISTQNARNPRLGEVYHAAPDADLRGFVDDLRDYAQVARRVTIALNMSDSALRLSEVVNRGSRAGRPNMAELSNNQLRFLMDATDNHGVEILRVKPEKISDMSTTSHAFWYDDPWVSSDVLATFLFHLPPAERGLTSGKTSDGKTYWTFPSDYDARLPGVLDALRPRVAAPAEKSPVEMKESA